MTLEITLGQDRAMLKLIKSGRVLDSEMFSYYHDLDDKLITCLDKLLRKHKIDITAIKDYKITGEASKNGTSGKIAQTVVEGLKS